MQRFVFFDFDGTLADTSEGIYAAFDDAAIELGLGTISGDRKTGLIGPPIKESFKKYYGLDELEARRAAEVFREQYAKQEHLLKTEFYSGIKETLQQLSEEGYVLGVATNKRTDCAERILTECGLRELFATVRGSESGSYVTKDQIVAQALHDVGCTYGFNGVMVGDTSGDFDAAMKNGLSFVGVTYGFGFYEGSPLGGADGAVSTPAELPGTLCHVFESMHADSFYIDYDNKLFGFYEEKADATAAMTEMQDVFGCAHGEVKSVHGFVEGWVKTMEEQGLSRLEVTLSIKNGLRKLTNDMQVWQSSGF